MIDPEKKAWIDSATYMQLLDKWRFAPVGDAWFQGDTGQYFREAIARKRDEDPEAAVRASKTLGWER